MKINFRPVYNKIKCNDPDVGICNYFLHTMLFVYFAKWILLPTFEVLHNGAISIENGKIREIGSRSHVQRGNNDHVVNLGDIFLLPGLINIHTHLEENALRDMTRQESETFAAWLAKRNSKLKQLPHLSIEKSIALGARELLSHGITTVADFSKLGLASRILSGEAIRHFAFHEAHPQSIEEEDAIIDALSKRAGPHSHDRYTGVGPYSLFSLSPKSHRTVAALAKNEGFLYAIHIAESNEELQAFSEQTGDLFFHISRKKGWPYGVVRRGSMDFALQEDLVPQNAICIHCNYLSIAEFERLAQKNASVVLCFQYSKEMEHKEFPLDVAINRGLNLCAGTESISCERSLNLFDELYCARKQFPHISAKQMLRWVTSNPALALGASNVLGSLDTGKFADFIGVRFHADPGDNILDELIVGEPEIRLVVINGEEIIADY